MFASVKPSAATLDRVALDYSNPASHKKKNTTPERVVFFLATNAIFDTSCIGLQKLH
jgi:hypothetical protein